jgi:dihydroorotase
MKLHIINAYVVDPSQEFEDKAEILIEEGKIKTLSKGERIKNAAAKDKNTEVFDAQGMYIFPGLIDMHTHLREPGFEHKETIRTGTLAALRGGFTTVCAMPNTNPVNDNAGITEFILKKAEREGNANVLPIGAITKGQKGEELAELSMMLGAGCVAFSDDGHPVASSLIMRRALEYARGFDALIISHSEDPRLSEGGVMNEGLLSISMGLKGVPSVSEEVFIYRDIALAEYTDTRIHIAHVSTEGSVRIIREAKERGVPVTAETCPHYFSLTEDAVADYNTNAKVNPPLRNLRDVQAIKQGLLEGTIDVIATDHAPHSLEEKTREFDNAPFGISGLETALSLSMSLVEEGVLSLKDLIRKLTVNPAYILHINKGTLKEGSDAELCVFDPSREFILDSSMLLSRGKNTPFLGHRMKGQVIATLFKGKLNKW